MQGLRISNLYTKDKKMPNYISNLFCKLNSLVIFRNLLSDPVIAYLKDALSYAAQGNNDLLILEALAKFENKLFQQSTCWTDYLLDTALEDENIYITKYAINGRGNNPLLDNVLDCELEFLENFGQLTLDDILNSANIKDADIFSNLPRWQTEQINFAAKYLESVSNISTRGYGMYATHSMFVVENKQLVPVKHPDMQKLEDLPGYEQERKKIVENTEALLNNMPANNILLYGDAGTGKSSAIKAVANEYISRGLRLVEIKKNQLFELPEILESLSSNPLKFIVFIDDLSFTTDDKDFAALKAILEGSVCKRGSNVVVYATSNRRHLIKETMEDRAGTDIHESDTRQELMSLSARFGLVITFMQPDKKKYASIVETLAKKANITEDTDSLIIRAERFAIRAGGRSPRAAKQFIDLVNAGVNV